MKPHIHKIKIYECGGTAPVIAGALLLAILLSACSVSDTQNLPQTDGLPKEDEVIVVQSAPRSVMKSLSGELFEDNYLRLKWTAENENGFLIYAADASREDYELFSTLHSGQTEAMIHLKSCRDYNVKVVCLNSSGEYGDELEISTRTGVSVVDAAFWTNKKLAVYDGPYSELKIAEAEPGTRFTVLAEYEDSHRFKIRLENGDFGYVNSNYCMINVPDYLGDLCAYDITNGRFSAFTIHEFEIPGVSGQIIPGYESVYMQDGSFLVPLLYPTAKKLAEAANVACSKGYRLKIYDAYRPKCATVYLYDQASVLISTALPEESFTGKPVSVLTAGGETIYKDFLNAQGWKIGSFLAKGASNHNKGTALDLTLEHIGNGSEAAASTLMHDLSVYSTVKNGNTTSKLLYEIMTSCGLSSIQSEWWHFQDNESMKKLSLEACNSPVS